MTTAISIVVSLISLSSGFFIIFQNLFYIPIILACIFYLRRGLIFSLLLALLYLALLLSFAGVEQLLNGVIRVFIFITVACVITYLAERWKGSERSLEKKHEELSAQYEEIVRIRDELAESNEYQINLITHANAPVIVWDRDGRITQFNGAFGQLTGIPPEQVIGSHLELLSEVLFPEESRSRSMDLVRCAMAGEPLDVIEIPIQHRSGEVRTVLWNSANIHDSDGKRIIATIVQGQDITDRKRAEEALFTANKKLNLLSSITRHDINNQLTVILGYLTLLGEDQPDPAVAETYRKVIITAVEQVVAMIRFTKEYENIGVHAPAWQDLRALADTAAGQAPPGQVQVKNDLPAGADVFADPLIGKVFSNLVDNAVRHGGKVTTIRFSGEEAGGSQVIVCEDDGAGIPAGEKERIFERGFGKNTGFGLFLAREVLEITGITIRETGVEGEGARFEIHVPEGGYRSRDMRV